ncbi:MAG TPA: DNA alkylation repair protein [Candidatus Saccharimonadales bacterium]|nr:DNA alkylation repair protein [Candidatus Saccharimonadales bacterium]
MSKPVSYIADHLRRVLIDGGSAPHTAEVQWFFKEEIQSRGWYTKELRKLARRFGRVIRREEGIDYLIGVADNLFHGNVLEEKILAVLLLEPFVGEFTAAHFKMFEEWLDRVSTWADHDGLVQYIIGHMIVADPRRLRRVFVWSRSGNRWRRRAAAVALLRGTNQGLFWDEVQQITQALLKDEDDMVRKGLAWLLRETARFDGARTMSLLMSIRKTAPRLVLRAACERLLARERALVLGR